MSEEVGCGLKVVTMAELRLDVLTEPLRTGETVADVCRRYGISRDTYYRYRRRYLAEGLDGLEDQSRRPSSSPVKMLLSWRFGSEMRKDHRRGVPDGSAPSWSERGSTLRRSRRFIRCWSVTGWFRPSRPDDLEPINGSSGRSPTTCGRSTPPRSSLVTAPKVGWLTSSMTIPAICWLLWPVRLPPGSWRGTLSRPAASRYGLPRQVLSDNGLCFTGRLHGTEVMFETSLDELGVEMINSAPYHPQTLGKLERFHRTLKEWLQDEGPPFDLEHLQELLDGFRFHYNRRRPHQGIGDQTPAERYGTEPLPPSQIRLPGPEEMTGPSYPPHSILRKVGSSGNLGYSGKLIQVGRRWAGATLRVIPLGELIHIYYGEMVIRTLTINPDRYYQGLNGRRNPNGRRKTTTTSTTSVR